MADAYISHESLLYRPDHDGPEKQILSPGEYLVQKLEWSGEMEFQTEAIVGALYVDQEPRGNAQESLTLVTAKSYNNRLEAEWAAKEHIEYRVHNPKGILYHDYAFDASWQPTEGDAWIATLRMCDPLPMGSDYWYGIQEKLLRLSPVTEHSRIRNQFVRIMKAAWRAYKWEFVLTKEEE